MRYLITIYTFFNAYGGLKMENEDFYNIWEDEEFLRKVEKEGNCC